MVSETPKFQVGDRVIVQSHPAFLKTADPMPMLRPADLITVGEAGQIMEQRPGGYWAVKFAQGTFLLEASYLQREGESP